MSKGTDLLNQIPVGTIITLTGTLKFSRLTKNLDGDALQKDIIRRQQRGEKYITREPHTSISLCDCTYEQPANPIVGQYIATLLYQSKSQGYTGYCFQKDNKGSLPWIGARQPDGSVKQIGLSSELANNQRVTVVLNVYKSKLYGNNGLGLMGVIVESPDVQCFGDGLTDRLKEAGIIFNTPIVPQNALNTPMESDEEPVGEAPAPTQGYTQPLNQPVTPPTAGSNPYSANPQTAYAQNVPFQQSQPTFPYPPAPTGATTTFPNPQQASANVPSMNPPEQAQPAYTVPQMGSEDNPRGIVYEGLDRQYH